MNSKYGLIVSIFVVSCLSLPLKAHALGQQYVTKAGLGMAGMIQIGGSNMAYFAVKPWDNSACEFHFLGINGLDQDYEIFGTNALDWWTFPNAPTAHCGYTMTPLIQNGRYLDYHTGGAGDVVFAGYGPNYVFGDGDGDLIGSSALAHPDVRTFGGTGNDTIKGAGHAYDALYGEDGNDLLCEPPNSPKAAIMNGGAHTDTRCGDAWLVTDVEFTNCSGCGY